MKKISVLFLSVFMLMFVSCSQLFDFSAKNASVSFSIPESMMNDLRDQGATPVENSLIINIVVKDQNGKVVKSINELRQLKQFSQEIVHTSTHRSQSFNLIIAIPDASTYSAECIFRTDSILFYNGI